MFFEADVNYLAVVLGAIAAQPLGALWYGPLFGERWMELRGYTKEDIEDGGGIAYFIGFAGHLVMAYAIARLADMTGAANVGESMLLAGFIAASFVVTVLATQIAFSPRRSHALLGIEGGYQFTAIVVIGAIVGAFQ